MARYRRAEKSHIWRTLSLSNACARKYNAPPTQPSIKPDARNSAERLTVAGEKARTVTAIRLAASPAALLILLYVTNKNTVPARTDGMRSISSDRPR